MGVRIRAVGIAAVRYFLISQEMFNKLELCRTERVVPNLITMEFIQMSIIIGTGLIANCDKNTIKKDEQRNMIKNVLVLCNFTRS